MAAKENLKKRWRIIGVSGKSSERLPCGHIQHSGPGRGLQILPAILSPPVW
jgi:hypothetical protein